MYIYKISLLIVIIWGSIRGGFVLRALALFNQVETCHTIYNLIPLTMGNNNIYGKYINIRKKLRQDLIEQSLAMRGSTRSKRYLRSSNCRSK